MVGGAVLVGDLDGGHPQRRRQRSRHFERAVGGAGHRTPGARERGAALGHGHQRVEAEALAVAERLERRGAGAVADQRARGKRLRGRADLAVGDGEEHDAALRLRAAAERALDLDAGVAQRGGQGVAKPAGADDGAALRG